MKTLNWPTNYNGKLACKRFIHIDLAPEKVPTGRQLKETTFTIEVADKSHPPVQVQVDSLVILRIGEIGNIHTWPSHGMSDADFIEWQHRKKVIHKESQFAIYYYRKIN